MLLKKTLPFFCFLCLVTLTAQAQLTLNETEIIRLLPENLMSGFTIQDRPKSKMMKVGNLTYSLAEKNFVLGKKMIKILLFDYSEASIMYSQATKKFVNVNEVESDSLVLRTLIIENGNGWEVDNSRNHSSQIQLGIFERFYLTMEGINVPLEELKEAFEMIRVEKFPR